jgi:putative acetyltransferase
VSAELCGPVRLRGSPALRIEDAMTVDIHPTRPQELPAVFHVHHRAFGGRPNEARVVELLHARNKAPISLAATVEGQVVAHVLFSPIRLEPAPHRLNAVGLAPVGVLPEHQRRGIGSRLIRAGLECCRDAGYDAVVVLGNPLYYSRFGFVRARDHGLGNDYAADEAFRVIELRPKALEGLCGTVKYQPEFEEAGC